MSESAAGGVMRFGSGQAVRRVEDASLLIGQGQFTDDMADADTRIESGEGLHVIRMPEHYGELSPLLHVVPLQLLAYHTACARGTDVDKPRNLAKSVTVE